MPILYGQQLHDIAHRILTAAGVPDEHANVIATELAEANLVGHDSHGVMRLVQYAKFLDDGHVDPHGGLEVVAQAAGFAVVDGRRQFGQVTATWALEVGIEGAKRSGAFTVMVRNCNHVGRLGSYTEKAARRGFAALMSVNGPGPGGVAPFGGIDRRLGTNPISMAAPFRDGAIVLDMTTSVTAEGKVRVAFQKGVPLPEGMIVDHAGNSSTNPADLYGPPPGAILPLGGPMAHKGFGLAVMVDIFAGILSGSGIARTDLPPGANGVWMAFFDVSQFLPRADYDAMMERYAAHLKSSRRMPGVDEILLPGEIEQRRRAEREAAGVEVPDETWRQLNELAARLGVSLADFGEGRA
jgi:hydroxycarboxylate dehydrogenase B